MTSQIDYTFSEPEHFSKALSTYRSAYRTAKPFPLLPGDRLAIHADLMVDKQKNPDPRVNVLSYLNREWLDGYGVYLEFLDEKMIRCEAKISRIFDWYVIYNTTLMSFHWHPEPLQCRADRTRNPVAWYDDTNGRPAKERQKLRSALWRSRSNDGAKVRSVL